MNTARKGSLTTVKDVENEEFLPQLFFRPWKLLTVFICSISLNPQLTLNGRMTDMPMELPDDLVRLMKHFETTLELNRIADAEFLLGELEDIIDESRSYQLSGILYSAMAQGYSNINDRENAIVFFMKSKKSLLQTLRTCPAEVTVFFQDNLRAVLGNLADLLRDTNRTDEALLIYLELESAARLLGQSYWVQAALNNQGFIHLNNQRYIEALEAFIKQEEVCSAAELYNDLGKAIYMQIQVHMHSNNEARSMVSVAKLIRLAEEHEECRIYTLELNRQGYLYGTLE